ncbi:hypothetical protein Ddye_012274 [Dipteronia dyeriana]|uniref:Transmembrane protein n=1 Tax=Dipteronia dyeriana TaxID=168575 RepID=A0AAD9X487_9ROSI|nr:hypothetical protein Ddye_012274 [Dipteronia dyeriana]
MARPFLNLSKPIKKFQFQIRSQQIMTFFFALMTIFSLVSIISLLCASHKRKKSHTKIEETSSQSDKKLLKKLNSSISSKTHHLMVKMTSWRKVRDEGGEGEGEDEDFNDEAVWRRTIIIGERCRPLEFSGKILYDSEGNLLPNDSLQKHDS